MKKKLILLNSLMILLLALMKFVGPPETLDAKLYYTGEAAVLLINDLESINKNKYLNNEMIDLLFIITYTFTFNLALKILYQNNFKLVLLGFLPGTFDAIETLSIVCILISESCKASLEWLGIITLLKWIFVFVVCFVIVYKFVNLKISLNINANKF